MLPDAGSVYQAPDGRWRGVVDVGWIDGRRQRKYVSGATQARALEKLRQAQRAADAGVVSDDRITVAVFLERWLQANLAGSVAGRRWTITRTRHGSTWSLLLATRSILD